MTKGENELQSGGMSHFRASQPPRVTLTLGEAQKLCAIVRVSKEQGSKLGCVKAAHVCAGEAGLGLGFQWTSDGIQ